MDGHVNGSGSRDCQAVSARVRAMDAPGLSDDVFPPEEDEDLAIKAAKTILSGDTG